MADTTQADVPPEDILAGVPEGTVLDTPQGQPDEKIVYDRAEDGTVIGWHKEAV